MWDDEVAVLAVGAGPGGQAYAAVAADAGLDVLIATPPSGPAAPPAARGWLPIADDPLTEEYLSELTAGVTVPAEPASADLTVRALHTTPRPRSGKAVVQTFDGAQLPVWAATCLASPYGAVLTTVDHWPATRRTRDGRSVGVATLGGADGRAVSDWIADAVRERDIAVLGDAALRRLVFEDGRAVGAVFDTPDGEYAVHARHGLALAPARVPALPAVRPSAETEFALVGLAGSRFVRLELVHTEDMPG
ncbi:FAD-binding protein [Mycolicibacterium cosmeticum]|uniref:FAD-binding protein n=1 Tax=Mycolicibacterium cosmeticum TaxID=258533 RepID=UPI003204691A